MIIFLISLLIPGTFNVLGGTTLNASRLVVLVAIIPLTIAWLSGQAGKIILPDILILLHAVWILIAYVVNHGTERIPYGIVTGIELFGGYLMGRILIRSPEDFRRFFSYIIVAFLALLPFALYETWTDRAILQNISRSLLGISYSDVSHDPRSGFYRVQSVFQHPILFGVFCSISIAPIYYIWRDSVAKALPRAGLALFMTFSSLSSGPLLAGMIQLCFIAWGRLTNNAWKALVGLTAGMYIFLSFASNRGPVLIIIETLTFNPGTGWHRIHIYRNGIQNVWANPVFGIGMNDWVRASWLPSSVDNFWLLVAMRFGVVGFCLLAAGVMISLLYTIRAKNLSQTASRYRIGYVASLAGLCFTLTTVHVWGPTYILVLFFIGAGAWMFTSQAANAREEDNFSEPLESNRRGKSSHSRDHSPAGSTYDKRQPPFHARPGVDDPGSMLRPSDLPCRRHPQQNSQPYRKD